MMVRFPSRDYPDLLVSVTRSSLRPGRHRFRCPDGEKRPFPAAPLRSYTASVPSHTALSNCVRPVRLGVRVPILQLHKVCYWSQGDENAMFAWLRSIPGVRRYWGVKTTLFVSVRSRLSKASVRELEALWRRYGTPKELIRVRRDLAGLRQSVGSHRWQVAAQTRGASGRRSAPSSVS